MITWGKETAERAEKIAERIATLWLIFSAGYILGHVIAAWLRGSFHLVVPR